MSKGMCKLWVGAVMVGVVLVFAELYAGIAYGQNWGQISQDAGQAARALGGVSDVAGSASYFGCFISGVMNNSRTANYGGQMTERFVLLGAFFPLALLLLIGMLRRRTNPK